MDFYIQVSNFILQLTKQIENTNQQMMASKNDVYKKTKYWNQQASNIKDSYIEELIKQLIIQLTRIEAKLNNIENILNR